MKFNKVFNYYVYDFDVNVIGYNYTKVHIFHGDSYVKKKELWLKITCGDNEQSFKIKNP